MQPQISERQGKYMEYMTRARELQEETVAHRVPSTFMYLSAGYEDERGPGP